MSVEYSVTVIVLNWNGKDLLKDCLESLEKVEYPNYNILVVDNGSSDESVSYVQTEFPHVDLLILDQNYGYAKGNNRGFEYAKKKGAEYVIFLNNDTIVEPNFIKPLLEPFKDKSVGQTAPKIYYADNREKIWYAGGKINFWSGNVFHEGIRDFDSEKYRKNKETDYATGCCFCIRSEDYSRMNGFDETFSMYGEDVDLSLRINKQSQFIYFIPESKIYHKVSASVGGAFSLGKIKRKMLANAKLMFKYAHPLQWVTQIACLPFLFVGGFIKYFKYK